MGRASVDAPIVFQTRSGPLSTQRLGLDIEMDFPALPVRLCEPPAGLVAALGVEPTCVGNYGMDYLCEVADEAMLRAIRPDFGQLRQVPTRGTVVTCRATGAEYDFVSRFFAPAVGVPEDPVTGSAHCALAPYWASKLGQSMLVGYQASRRGGLVRVVVRGERVGLAGRAVTVVRGQLLA
jgi:predicted PhzF superfamily epimerase YddE/YHI9